MARILWKEQGEESYDHGILGSVEFVEELCMRGECVICYLAVRQGWHGGVKVGRQVNLRLAGVSVAVNRGEKLVEADQAFLALIDK